MTILFLELLKFNFRKKIILITFKYYFYLVDDILLYKEFYYIKENIIYLKEEMKISFISLVEMIFFMIMLV